MSIINPAYRTLNHGESVIGVQLYREQKYICAIKSLSKINPSLISVYYKVKSFSRLEDVCGLFTTVNSAIVNDQLSFVSSLTESIRFSLRGEIDALKALIRDTLYADFTVHDKLKALESFFLSNNLIIFYCSLLLSDNSRLVSNVINIMGDLYVLTGRYRSALTCYELATNLFEDSVYARINYADLAYRVRDYGLCISNLSHANHLIYHSGNETGLVYDPHSTNIVKIDDLVFNNFTRLCRNTGFAYG